MQIRETTASERIKMSDFSMLMVTPLKALLVNCTEVSQTFSEKGIEKMKVCLQPAVLENIMGCGIIINLFFTVLPRFLQHGHRDSQPLH